MKKQEPYVLDIQKHSIYYDQFQAVKEISLGIDGNKVTSIIGPSGCGKSTLLRSLNRMNDFIGSVRTEGDVLFDGNSIFSKNTDVVDLRRKIGMVFQKPNPFPKSIYKNVAWGPSVNGYMGDLDDCVERALKRAALWDEVKDKLDQDGLSLSGGQQQRLCIARALAMEPEVILMDEPCSALDPISTSRVEDLLLELKKDYTIVIVTHSMQQAARVSDKTAFMYQGNLVEYGETQNIFTRPEKKQTEDYVTGKFG